MTASSISWSGAAKLSWRAPVLLIGFALSLAPAIVLARLVLDSAIRRSPASIVMMGIIVGVVVGAMLRRRLEFANTYGHEHAHMFAALLLFRPISEFRASTATGGHVTYLGNWSLWIAAAPYTLPLSAFAAVGLSLITHGTARPTILAGLVIGLAIGYHVAIACEHGHRNFALRSVKGAVGDFAAFGRLWTTLYIWILNVAILGTLFAFAAGGSNGATRFWRDSARVVAGQTATILALRAPSTPPHRSR
jgi:hypothetical protein